MYKLKIKKKHSLLVHVVSDSYLPGTRVTNWLHVPW